MPVKCPKCNYDNPETQKFCGDCGTPLPTVDDIVFTETLEGLTKPLTTGFNFAGRYQIIEELGHGGMGVVYKAEDTRLKRLVALKFLPEALSRDRHALERFEREAQAASALNHPHICTIYDIDEYGGQHFIAMELVDGRTLDELISHKGMKLGDALKYAVQVADALAAAHEGGIVHRDLKPGNIMATSKGQAKVLDFGLAKLTETLPAVATRAARSAKSMTQEGTIVGTVAYMSPEQAEGKRVDTRSDIFSFGSVLYEMVTGERAFQGDSRASTLAALLKENPKPASQLVKGLPREVERLISRCLQKDVEKRFQHMDDVKIALEELKEESDLGTLAVAHPPRAMWRLRLRLAAITLTIIGLAIALWIWLGRSRPLPETHLEAVPLTSYPGQELAPSFSPDGTMVAFEWAQEGLGSYVFIKQIGVEPPTRLTNSFAAETSPAWSPDGRSIAFIRWVAPRRQELIVVPQRGGRERVLAELDISEAWDFLSAQVMAWTPDSKWLACPCPTPGQGNWSLFLFSVELAGKKTLTRPPAQFLGDTTPSFSPDGRFLVFSREVEKWSKSDLYWLRLGEGFAPQGEAIKIQSNNSWNFGSAWIPGGKEIVFASGTAGASGLWRTALGKNSVPRRLSLAQNQVFEPTLSRQGDRLAFAVEKFDSNIWRLDLSEPGGVPSAPVKLIASTQDDYAPAFSPDGRQIAFRSSRSGTNEIWVCDSDGSNPTQVTQFGGGRILGPRWSPDGQRIVVSSSRWGGWNVYVVNVNGGPPQQITNFPSKIVAQHPSWSRDGKSIYFCSSGNGPAEIWKVPAGGGKAVQITRNPNADGAAFQLESPDGKFLFFSRGWPSPMSVWKIPVNGGKEIKVLDSVVDSAGNWTLGRHGIYFATGPDQYGHQGISFYDLETGKTRKILPWDRSNICATIAVSPDERTFLIPQMDEFGSDLMLIEKFR